MMKSWNTHCFCSMQNFNYNCALAIAIDFDDDQNPDRDYFSDLDTIVNWNENLYAIDEIAGVNVSETMTVDLGLRQLLVVKMAHVVHVQTYLFSTRFVLYCLVEMRLLKKTNAYWFYRADLAAAAPAAALDVVLVDAHHPLLFWALQSPFLWHRSLRAQCDTCTINCALKCVSIDLALQAKKYTFGVSQKDLDIHKQFSSLSKRFQILPCIPIDQFDLIFGRFLFAIVSPARSSEKRPNPQQKSCQQLTIFINRKKERE